MELQVQDWYVHNQILSSDEVHSRATSRRIVSTQTKINVMKSFKKNGRKRKTEKEKKW